MLAHDGVEFHLFKTNKLKTKQASKALESLARAFVVALLNIRAQAPQNDIIVLVCFSHLS